MPYRLFSKGYLRKLALTLVVSGIGLGSTAALSTPVALAGTSAQADQDAQALIQKLTAVHDALVSDGQLSTIEAAATEAAATAAGSVDWATILYGTSSGLDAAQQQGVTAVKQSFTDVLNDIVHVPSQTTLEDQVSADLGDFATGLNSGASFAITDMYSLFEAFKSDVAQNLDASQSVSTIGDNALMDAAKTADGGKFVGLLSNVDLHISDFPSIRSRFDADFTDARSLETALMDTAVKSNVSNTLSLTAGNSQPYMLQFQNIGSGLDGLSVPSNLIQLSSNNSHVTIIDNNTIKAVSPGTATVTVKLKGNTNTYTVQTIAVTVTAASTGGGGFTGGGGGGGSVTPPPTTTTPPTPPAGTGNAYTTVLTTQSVKTSGGSFTTSSGNTSVKVDVPAGAFATPEDVTITSGNASDTTATFAGTKYDGYKPTVTFGVNFSGANPTIPITVTITNPSIPANAEVFKVASDGSLHQVSAIVSAGQLTITFSSDPDFVVAVPIPTTGTSTGGNGGTTGGKGSSGTSPVHYTYHTKGIYLNGKSLYKVPSFVKDKTTYMPIWYVMQALDKIGFQNSWNGQSHTWSITAPKGDKPDLSNIHIGSGAGIKLNGTLVERVPAVAATDPSSKKATTFAPIWYVMQALRRAHVNTSWNGSTWFLSSKTAADEPVLKIGAHGSAVLQLQQLLGITADGDFGPMTLAAVEKFQHAHGLSVDGVVGKNTWSALLQG